MQGLTTQLAEWAAGSAALVLPPQVQAAVCNGFTDTAAVMLAGREEPVTRIVRGWAATRRTSGGACSVLLDPGPHSRTNARDAALVNATAAHALDYDDVGLQGHPSAVLVPALLAEGERLDAGGAALLRAYVVGYEVWAELIARDQDVHHLKGWHPTAVFGTVASAAAVAALRGLNMERCRHAIALAASMAGGLIANFGSMAKPFHAGQAAAHGIDAADLAEAGMTAAPDVLEHPNGFLTAISPAGRVERAPAVQPLGSTLRIATLGLTVKKYPMCFATHRAIDATLDLVHAHGVHPTDVQAVHATVGVAQAAMLRNHRPADALAGKFSLEFAIAAALVARRVGLAELTDGFLRQPSVQALIEQVQIATTNTQCAHEPTLAASDRVVIALRDGRQLDSGDVPGTRGDVQTPLLPGELLAKFEDCCAHAGVEGAQELYARLQSLATLPSVRGLSTPTPPSLRA